MLLGVEYKRIGTTCPFEEFALRRHIPMYHEHDTRKLDRAVDAGCAVRSDIYVGARARRVASSSKWGEKRIVNCAIQLLALRGGQPKARSVPLHFKSFFSLLTSWETRRNHLRTSWASSTELRSCCPKKFPKPCCLRQDSLSDTCPGKSHDMRTRRLIMTKLPRWVVARLAERHERVQDARRGCECADALFLLRKAPPSGEFPPTRLQDQGQIKRRRRSQHSDAP